MQPPAKDADSHRDLEEMGSFPRASRGSAACPHLGSELLACSVQSPDVWELVTAALGNEYT